MRKIVYSNVTKFIAVLLFIASIVCGVLIATDGTLAYFNQDEEIYNFESDFSESWYILNLLNDPETVVYYAYRSVFHPYDESGNPVSKDMDAEETRLEMVQNLEERFSEYYYSEVINYFIQWNDFVLTNCGAESPEALMQGQYYSYLKRSAGGYVERELPGRQSLPWSALIEEIAAYDNESTIIISCSVNEDTVAETKAIWELQEAIVTDTFTHTAVCAAVALMTLIYLICVCGKTKDGEYKNMWLDNVWLEAHLAAITAFGIGGAAIFCLVINQYAYGNFPGKLVYPILGAVSGLVSLILISSLLCMIRNIKTRRLVESSIVLRVVRWCFRLVGKIVRWCRRTAKSFRAVIYSLLSKKTGVILISLLFGYTVFIGILGILTPESPIPVIIGVLLFGFALFVVARRSADLDQIKKGVSEVRNGNVAYKIPEVRCRDMKVLAASINHIALGLDESVAAKMKAERLKTELITNVSHDLKHPSPPLSAIRSCCPRWTDCPMKQGTMWR